MLLPSFFLFIINYFKYLFIYLFNIDFSHTCIDCKNKKGKKKISKYVKLIINKKLKIN